MNKLTTFLTIILIGFSFTNIVFAVEKEKGLIPSPETFVQGVKNYYFNHIHGLLLSFWMEEDISTPRTLFQHLQNNYDGALEQILDWHIPNNLEIKNKEEKISFHLDCVVAIKSLDGFGSGFYIKDNYIITNYHVVKEKNKVKIKKFESDTFVNANVVAEDIVNDIALLKSNTKNNSCIINNYKLPKKNFLSEVISVGYSKGLEFNITQGLVNEYFDMIENLGDILVVIPLITSKQIHNIKIDKAVHSGISGGPLFHKGLVVGMNTGVLKGASLNAEGYIVSQVSIAVSTNVICNFLSQQNETRTLCKDNQKIIDNFEKEKKQNKEQSIYDLYYFYIAIFLFIILINIIYFFIRRIYKPSIKEKEQEL